VKDSTRGIVDDIINSEINYIFTNDIEYFQFSDRKSEVEKKNLKSQPV